MTSVMGETVEHRRLRAPAEQGATLVDPPLGLAGELIARNSALLAGYDCDIQGRPIKQLAAQARQELVGRAWAYTRTYRNAPQPSLAADTPILLAGHQPQLFHPGVWYKNFVLSGLARRHAAVAVNLVIDSDTIKTAGLRVPGGGIERPMIENIPFDRSTAEIPYEERPIVDRQCLTTFGDRAGGVLKSTVPDSLLSNFWPLVAERGRECDNLGLCVAQARHRQEGLWGAETLELPQSSICSLEAFYWFACHLLARLPRLWEVYNQSVVEYRRANGVRSTAHPVPDLAAQDVWLEAPFWIWTADDPRRRRMFVCQRGDEIVLSDRGVHELWLPLTPESDAGRAAERLAEYAARGIKIRTRALITTMFARLMLGDLFLHGIGGAKYDQVTDLLISRFFGLEPPAYMTLTATLRLPPAEQMARGDDERTLDQHLRELAFHPEHFLNGALNEPAVSELVSQKRRWISTPATAENAKLRCREIRRVNQSLQPWLAPLREQLSAQRQTVAESLRAARILSSREYAFCFYPEQALQALLQPALEG